LKNKVQGSNFYKYIKIAHAAVFAKQKIMIILEESPWPIVHGP
jgi:hypothetical protein